MQVAHSVGVGAGHAHQVGQEAGHARLGNPHVVGDGHALLGGLGMARLQGGRGTHSRAPGYVYLFEYVNWCYM